MGVGTRLIEKKLRKYPKAHKAYLLLLAGSAAIFGYAMAAFLLMNLDKMNLAGWIMLILFLGVGLFFTILLIGVIKGKTPAQKAAEEENKKDNESGAKLKK